MGLSDSGAAVKLSEVDSVAGEVENASCVLYANFWSFFLGLCRHSWATDQPSLVINHPAVVYSVRTQCELWIGCIIILSSCMYAHDHEPAWHHTVSAKQLGFNTFYHHVYSSLSGVSGDRCADVVVGGGCSANSGWRWIMSVHMCFAGRNCDCEKRRADERSLRSEEPSWITPAVVQRRRLVKFMWVQNLIHDLLFLPISTMEARVS